MHMHIHIHIYIGVLVDTVVLPYEVHGQLAVATDVLTVVLAEFLAVACVCVPWSYLNRLAAAKSVTVVLPDATVVLSERLWRARECAGERNCRSGERRDQNLTLSAQRLTLNFGRLSGVER
jgi:hypothetical protein